MTPPYLRRETLLWAICHQLGPERPDMPIIAVELSEKMTAQLRVLYLRGTPMCWKHRVLMTNTERPYCRICHRAYVRRWNREKAWKQPWDKFAAEASL